MLRGRNVSQGFRNLDMVDLEEVFSMRALVMRCSGDVAWSEPRSRQGESLGDLQREANNLEVETRGWKLLLAGPKMLLEESVGFPSPPRRMSEPMVVPSKVSGDESTRTLWSGGSTRPWFSLKSSRTQSMLWRARRARQRHHQENVDRQEEKGTIHQRAHWQVHFGQAAQGSVGFGCRKLLKNLREAPKGSAGGHQE